MGGLGDNGGIVGVLLEGYRGWGEVAERVCRGVGGAGGGVCAGYCGG